METAVSNIFSLLQNVIGVVLDNPLLSIMVGVAVAGLVFGLLMMIFKK